MLIYFKELEVILISMDLKDRNTMLWDKAMKFTILLLHQTFKSTLDLFHTTKPLIKYIILSFLILIAKVVPTGTMMGELGIKFGNHRFYVSSNETVATLDNLDVDLLSSWSVEFDGVVLSNVNEKGRMYQINFANNDVSVTFIRKLYTIRGLEDQWHFDYHAKLFSSGNNLHG